MGRLTTVVVLILVVRLTKKQLVVEGNESSIARQKYPGNAGTGQSDWQNKTIWRFAVSAFDDDLEIVVSYRMRKPGMTRRKRAVLATPSGTGEQILCMSFTAMVIFQKMLCKSFTERACIAALSAHTALSIMGLYMEDVLTQTGLPIFLRVGSCEGEHCVARVGVSLVFPSVPRVVR